MISYIIIIVILILINSFQMIHDLYKIRIKFEFIKLENVSGILHDNKGRMFTPCLRVLSTSWTRFSEVIVTLQTQTMGQSDTGLKR